MKLKNLTISLFMMIPILLVSCSGEKSMFFSLIQGVEKNINDIGDFFSVYFKLQLSILLTSLILGIFLGRMGSIIGLIAHFVWVVAYRDYGFWIVLLLFSIGTIITTIGARLLLLLTLLWKNRN